MTFQIEGSSNFRAGKACQGFGDATIQVALRSQKVRFRVRVRATVCESAERAASCPFPTEGPPGLLEASKEGAQSDIRASLKQTSGARELPHG